jgi:hypothetical protein
VHGHKYGHNRTGLDWFQEKMRETMSYWPELLSPQEIHWELTHRTPRLQHDKPLDLWKEASIEAVASRLKTILWRCSSPGGSWHVAAKSVRVVFLEIPTFQPIA